jgi:hypothetical protein
VSCLTLKNTFGSLLLFLFINTQATHIKSIIHNSMSVFSLKTSYPGGIRTRVFCSGGECDVHCSKPPGLSNFLLLSETQSMNHFVNRPL